MGLQREDRQLRRLARSRKESPGMGYAPYCREALRSFAPSSPQDAAHQNRSSVPTPHRVESTWVKSPRLARLFKVTLDLCGCRQGLLAFALALALNAPCIAGSH